MNFHTGPLASPVGLNGFSELTHTIDKVRGAADPTPRPVHTGRPIIVLVPQGGREDKDGVILSVQAIETLDQFIDLARACLHLSPIGDVRFCTALGDPLTTWAQIQCEIIVYIEETCIRRPIPGPKPYPLVGNLNVFMNDLVADEHRVLLEYNHLVSLSLMGARIVLTSDPVVAEHFLTEGVYFKKRIVYPFAELQAVAGNGLFTSDTDTDHWRLAHKLLIPAFSASAMRIYINQMAEIACDAVRIFETFADQNAEVDISHWTTNIALETIARVGFGYNFNLLDSPELASHPFVDAINFTLSECLSRMVLTPYWKHLPLRRNYEFQAKVKLMTDTVDQVVSDRRQAPELESTMRKDILGYMLNAYDIDEAGGKRYIDDINIRDQVITFLIAGHETTSNTLGWCLYLLNQHPKIMRRVLREIDDAELPDNGQPTSQQIAKLPYLTQCIKETMRLYPPIFLLVKDCVQDAVLPGGFECHAGTTCQVHTYGLHRNPDHWGPTPDQFNPDHFTPEAVSQRHPYAWMPFSTGPRSCIGLQFALQEMKIVLAYMLRKFEFRNLNTTPVPWDPKGITLKPMGLRMSVHHRDTSKPWWQSTDASGRVMQRRASSTFSAGSLIKQISSQSYMFLASKLSHLVLPPTMMKAPSAPLPPMPQFSLLFGSNMGMCEEYARQLGAQLAYLGCEIVQLQGLDDWLQDPLNFTAEGEPVRTGSHARSDRHFTVFLTSTYNGFAPDNGVKLEAYLQRMVKTSTSSTANSLSGLGSDSGSTTRLNSLETDPDSESDQDGSVRQARSFRLPFSHLRFAAFGCGNSQWVTFQAFPKLIQDSLKHLGATSVFPLGQCDSDKEDTDQIFSEWSAELATHLFMKLNVAPRIGAPVPDVSLTSPSGKNVKTQSQPHLSDLRGQELQTALDLEFLSDVLVHQATEVPSNSILTTTNIIAEVSSPSSSSAVASSTEQILLEQGYTPAFVTANHELRHYPTSTPPDTRRSTRHIELQTTSPCPYEAGDHIELAPQNPLNAVGEVAHALGLDLHQGFSVSPINAQRTDVPMRSLIKAIPPTSTVGDVLVYFADLLGAPPKSLYYAIAQVSGPDDKPQHYLDIVARHPHLRELGRSRHDDSDKTARALKALQAQYRTTAELLVGTADWTTHLLGFGWAEWLVHLHSMAPRRYSVASSPRGLRHHRLADSEEEGSHASEVSDGLAESDGCYQAHLTVAVINDQHHGQHYPGLVSGYLAGLAPTPPLAGLTSMDQVAQLWVRVRSENLHFRLPFFINPPPSSMEGKAVVASPPPMPIDTPVLYSQEAPVIMIAAGSGIAPFRGFLQARSAEWQSTSRRSTMALYFGCRDPAEDHLYADEMDSYQRSGILDHYAVAYSRADSSESDLATPHHQPSPHALYRSYVQQCLQADAERVWDLWHRQLGYLYVCGSTQLDSGVWSVLKDMAQTQGGMSASNAEQYLLQMKSAGRYCQDVWTP
ncbi:hypothetical protein H4R33_004305 [Dimargaris cristalligena]|nr:hypothetical protein H4R33_004305 [Dimargaris cristalligena]